MNGVELEVWDTLVLEMIFSPRLGIFICLERIVVQDVNIEDKICVNLDRMFFLALSEEI